jgi:hypothetical protein
MPPLLFPSLDAVRLALSSGAVPAELANGQVAVCDGERGELWVTPHVSPSREVIATLARMGVRTQAAPPHAHEKRLPHWAAVLPLAPNPNPRSETGRWLFVLANGRAAGFAARAARHGAEAIEVHLGDTDAMVRLTVSRGAIPFLDDPHTTAFRPAAADVWVRNGWRHPLEPDLRTAPDTISLVGPDRDWVVMTNPAWHRSRDVQPLTVRPVAPPPFTEPRAALRIPLRLRPTTTATGAESLWVFDSNANRLVELLRDADERLLRRFRIARVSAAAGERVLLRSIAKKRHPVLPPPFVGYVPHPSAARVFLPTRHVLTPDPRQDRLADVLGVDAASIVWLVPAAGGVEVHRVADTAFRPPDEVLTYTVASIRRLTVFEPTHSPFDLPAFVAEPEPHPPKRTKQQPATTPPAPTRTGGWLGLLTNKLFPTKRQTDRKPRLPGKAADKGQPATTALPRIGPEWNARRTQLERRVLDRHAAADVDERTALWVELATAQRDTGRAGDASVCWLNAVWEHDPPPVDWVVEWVRAEERAAKPPADRVLAHGNPRIEPVAAARVAAATVTRLGFARDRQPDTARVFDLMRQVEAHEHELPVRAVWLARLAAGRAAGGDPLGLAACRDRLTARLDTDGPAIDLDAPAFLRFHGSADGDRFRTAREWLLTAREPIHRWVQRQATGERLARAGIDPDLRPTTAYADLMLAWGLSQLGDRTRANEWAAQAEHDLSRCRGPGVDPAVHRVLKERFRSRIRAAQHGRFGPTPLRVSDPDDQLIHLSRFSVERLCERSVILSPTARSTPYRGRDLFPLVGTDPLGHRLHKLFERRTVAAVGSLLDEAVNEPTAGVLPRVTLCIAECEAELDPDTAGRVLGLLPAVLDLLPEAVRMSDTDRGYLVRMVIKTVDAGWRMALRHRTADGFGRVVARLTDRLERGDEVIREAVVARSGSVFVALRKLGLTGHAHRLLDALGADPPAVGWFVVGREDRGVQELDRARDRLFVTGVPDDETRGREAIRYVTALAHAPPRLALGRLAEVFQRLGRMKTHDGSARYFALEPLELIDRAVTAVVSDEFDPGPAVRRWLADDEFLIRRRIARDLTAALHGGV